MNRKRKTLLGLVTALGVAGFATLAHAQQAKPAQGGIMRNMAENKFGPFPGMPACMTGAVESGDPTKGPSVIIFKGTGKCQIPWHWHTPSEHVMIVKGSAKMEMKDGDKPVTLSAGGYGMMPSKHVHQFTCTAACQGFVYSDAAFDIHYVDAAGKEIPPETALAPPKKGK